MRAQPLTPSALVDHLVDLVLAASGPSGATGRPPGRFRVVVDGAPPTAPGRLADTLVGPLRAAGRAVVRVSADDFLRPASVRWEHGRTDPGAFYDDRLDIGALAREVVEPLGPAGAGRYLPSLWDAARDRATRAGYLQAPPGAVLLLDGTLLLGRWLDVDLTVHLAVRAGTLARRTAEEDRWTLPAFARYDDEVRPEEVADVVVRVDDARHPALVVSR